MKKYMDIQRPKDIAGFVAGDYIVVQEKIDGANFSIRYNPETGSVDSFSRKQELNMMNDLRGAWGFAQTLDPAAVKEALVDDGLILFGEWLVSHSVPYPQNRYQHAYFYDVYDTVNEAWLDQTLVKDIVSSLGLTYVPVFYEGPFQSWEHLGEMVGKTALGGEYGEGIVVKNMTRLNDPNTRSPFYVKLVIEKMKETNKSTKTVDPAKLAEQERVATLTATIVTKARVEKILHKMVDEGILPEDWNEENMGTIAKTIGKLIYEDCTKEEPEVVAEIGSTFGKAAQKTAMVCVREILSEKFIAFT